ARSGRRLRAGVLVDLVLGLLPLPVRLALAQVTGRAVAARRAFLLGVLRLARPLALVDRLGRVVLVLGFGVGRRAVALVHVTRAAVAHPPDRRDAVRLYAGSGGRLRAGVLVDVVLGLLLLPAPLALVGLIGRAVAARRALLAGPLSL